MGPRAGTPRTDCIPKAGGGGVPPGPPQLSEGAQPSRHLDFRHRPPEQWENDRLRFQAPQRVGICRCSPSNRVSQRN